MKVVITESKKEIPFPKLMESDNGTIVLMYREGEGTVLKKDFKTTREVGEHVESWHMEFFTDFEGKLELTNK